MWYVSDVRKFQNHYPAWKFEYDMNKTVTEMIQAALNK
jgi:CDP-paratose 2-epimerase